MKTHKLWIILDIFNLLGSCIIFLSSLSQFGFFDAGTVGWFGCMILTSRIVLNQIMKG